METGKKKLGNKYDGPERRICPYDICLQSEAAADRAVKKVFAILGVDIDKPEQVEKFREDLRFGEAMHKYAKRGMMTVVAVFAAAAAVAFIAGVVTKLKGE